jgi:hypothetical protein
LPQSGHFVASVIVGVGTGVVVGGSLLVVSGNVIVMESVFLDRLLDIVRLRVISAVNVG